MSKNTSKASKAKNTSKTPVVETPVVETPVVETPVVETPVVETPVVEAPVVEAPAEVVAVRAPKPDAKILAILSLATSFAASYRHNEVNARFARILANEASNPAKSSRFLSAKLASVNLDSVPQYRQHNPQQYHLQQLVKALSAPDVAGEEYLRRIGQTCSAYAEHEGQQNGRKNGQREALAERIASLNGIALANE